MNRTLIILCLLVSSNTFTQEPLYDFLLFANSRMDGSWFYSKAAYRSPSWIKNRQGQLPVSNATFFTPGNALELAFVNGKEGVWSASLFRPELRGQDRLQVPTHLSFHLYLDSNRTTLQDLPALQLLNRDSSASQKVLLKDFLQALPQKKWQRVKVPL